MPNYSGIWNLSSQANAKSAGTWPTAPNFGSYQLYSWGAGGSGQLGLGNLTSYSSPKQVGANVNWSQMSGGFFFSLGVKNDGTLWAWGSNTYGQLGLGNTTNYSSPKQVGALTSWLKVANGYGHTMAIKSDGTLWTWGWNISGQLGLGNTTYAFSSPQQVGSLTNWLSISGGYRNTIAVKTDGTLWAWGLNSFGQLGTGNTTNYSSPKQIGSLTNWLKVSSGQYFTTSVKTDGTAWSFGRNNNGQLGLGNITDYSSPKQIGALTTWSNIQSYSNAYFSLALQTNNTLWSWGVNTNGQLGLGNLTNYSSPKQVGSLTNWSYISAGENFSTAVKTDGTLWTWGINANGQLGLGNTTYKSSPNQVGVLTTWAKTACCRTSVLALSN